MLSESNKAGLTIALFLQQIGLCRYADKQAGSGLYTAYAPQMVPETCDLAIRTSTVGVNKME
jgi:hypothetical protein